MKKLISILIVLLWIFFYVIGFSTGWQRGFDACSKVWDDNIEQHLENIK